MQDKESKIPQDWFNIANRDLQRFKIMLKEKDFSAAGYYLQQAVEKYLKGYLLSNGWELKKTHNLVKLIDAAVKFDPSFEDFRQLCQRTTTYYTIERYPFFISEEPTEKELLEGLIKTDELKNKILNRNSVNFK